MLIDSLRTGLSLVNSLAVKRKERDHVALLWNR